MNISILDNDAGWFNLNFPKALYTSMLQFENLMNQQYTTQCTTHSKLIQMKFTSHRFEN